MSNEVDFFCKLLKVETLSSMAGMQQQQQEAIMVEPACVQIKSYFLSKK